MELKPKEHFNRLAQKLCFYNYYKTQQRWSSCLNRDLLKNKDIKKVDHAAVIMMFT